MSLMIIAELHYGGVWSMADEQFDCGTP